jgi:hypothetical protein
MFQYPIDQLLVSQRGIIKTEFGIGRTFFAKQRSERAASPFYERQKGVPVRGSLQIFDNLWLKACLVQESEYVAGRSAGWIMVDDDGVHGDPEGRLFPSYRMPERHLRLAVRVP